MLQCRDPGDAVGRLPIVDILIVGSITEIIGRDAHRLITMMNSDRIEKIDGIELNVKKERRGAFLNTGPNAKKFISISTFLLLTIHWTYSWIFVRNIGENRWEIWVRGMWIGGVGWRGYLPFSADCRHNVEPPAPPQCTNLPLIAQYTLVGGKFNVHFSLWTTMSTTLAHFPLWLGGSVHIYPGEMGSQSWSALVSRLTRFHAKCGKTILWCLRLRICEGRGWKLLCLVPF